MLSHVILHSFPEGEGPSCPATPPGLCPQHCGQGAVAECSYLSEKMFLQKETYTGLCIPSGADTAAPLTIPGHSFSSCSTPAILGHSF